MSPDPPTLFLPMSPNRSVLILTTLAIVSCGRSTPPQTEPPPQDPRVGLKAGLMDAGEAISNLKVVAKAVSPNGFLGITNSDLAFTGNYAIQGNYNGPVIWDITNPAAPVLVAVLAPYGVAPEYCWPVLA